MSEGIVVREIGFDSDAQKESIELRRLVLRKPIGLDFTTEELASEYNQFHFAAFEGNKLLAVLLLNPVVKDRMDVLKMRQVAVDPAHQGKGIGKQLVNYTEEWARNHGCKMFELHARASALQFYLSMQYHVVGEIFQEVGIPHYRMYKRL